MCARTDTLVPHMDHESQPHLTLQLLFLLSAIHLVLHMSS